jgi:hypothetical protein
MKLPNLNLTPGGILVGAGAVLLAPLVLPTAAQILRSSTKIGMKTAMLSYDKGKRIISDTTDAVSEITSEAKSEIFGGIKKQPEKATATK